MYCGVIYYFYYKIIGLPKFEVFEFFTCMTYMKILGWSNYIFKLWVPNTNPQGSEQHI